MLQCAVRSRISVSWQNEHSTKTQQQTCKECDRFFKDDDSADIFTSHHILINHSHSGRGNSGVEGSSVRRTAERETSRKCSIVRHHTEYLNTGLNTTRSNIQLPHLKRAVQVLRNESNITKKEHTDK
jgi:hypothetical protein